MNVINDTTILGQIKNTIANATLAIRQIEITQDEMNKFIASPQFKIYVDKHYAGYELDVPLGIVNHKTQDKKELVKSCWYRQTFLTVV